MRYTYGGTDGWHVTSITSSDGRSITFTYVGTSNRIQTVNDGTRTWTYSYTAAGALQSVQQPDGSMWTFSLGAFIRQPWMAPDPYCTAEEYELDFNEYTGTIGHPSGATSTFKIQMVRHGRSNVPGRRCVGLLQVPPVFETYALKSKTLSGPGMPPMTWQYAYSHPYASMAPCNGCVNTKTVTITDPLGHVTQNTYGTMYGINEGLLVSSAEGWTSGGSLRTTTYGYRASNAGPYPSRVGWNAGYTDSMNVIHTPQNQRTIIQQGVTFSQSLDNFDIYARAASVSRTSTLGTSRSEATVYEDRLNLWILGQRASKTVAGQVAASTTFHPTTAVPTESRRFGKPHATYVFNSDGTLQSVTDGRNHTTTLGSYYRGLPRSIAYPDGKGISAVVNNIGTIASVTNEANKTWTFGYDAMGRLSSKTPPIGNTTTLSFVQVPTSEVGIEPNHWRQTITTGNAVTINYFDARWRKRLTHTYDAGNIAGTQRTQRYDYDPYNRTTFAAYPVRSLATIATATPGTLTFYDALGRVTQTVGDSELGLLTTSTQYLAGFQKRVTDPRGNASTTSFQVFDEPSESAITGIAAPEGLTVTINRDTFGKPTAITRSGTYAGAPVSATRSYVYDGYQLLCKTLEPEIGATVQMLDGANNVAWKASGLNLPGTGCDWASVPEASKIAYTYDARNRVTGTGFGDGSPAIGRSYTDDGLPLTVVSGGSTWTYGYDDRRLLTSESLAYGQTFTIGRGYDANGHPSQLTYPDGTAVAYSPNALGEATQVSGYASGVTYHPNGAVAGYTLANGIVHSLTQNTRGLPLVNRDAGVLQDQYGYDANGNVAAITDQQEGIASRSLGYDGLDRLTAANSPGVWGAATYGYDQLGNLRSSVVGGRSAVHTYGANNLLTTLTVNGTPTGYAYDARGNVTGRGSQGFFFDIGNRMSLANGVASYSYDGHGRRVSVSGTNGVTKTHVYSQGGQLLYGQARQGMSTWLTRYVYLGDKLIAETDSSAGTSYSHTDALGSPVARTNGSGQLIGRTRYEPYGKTAAGTDPGSNGFTGIGFTGHVNDADTGLVYMQQRYYDPVAGRFLSVDPVVTDATTGEMFNRYEYALSNPYRYTDPYGLSPECSLGAGCQVAYQVERDSQGNAHDSPVFQGREGAQGSREGRSDNSSKSGSPSTTSYTDSRLRMADRVAGIPEETGRTAATVQGWTEMRPKLAKFFSDGSQVFIYGGAGVAFLPPPFDLPAIPLVGIGLGMDVLSDVLDPKPLKMGTDYLIDKAATRLGPAGAGTAGAAKAVKDLKNSTAVGNQ